MKFSFLPIMEFVLLFSVSCVNGQPAFNREAHKNDAFESFLSLFEKINPNDTQMVLLQTEFQGYGHQIDSSYFQFFETTPYFRHESAFRIDFSNGHVLGIKSQYGNDFTDIIFFTIYIYDLAGKILDKIEVPYIHIVGNIVHDRWHVLVSSEDIYCICKSKPNKTMIECEGVHFSIDYNHSRITRNPETQFSVPFMDGIRATNHN